MTQEHIPVSGVRPQRTQFNLPAFEEPPVPVSSDPGTDLQEEIDGINEGLSHVEQEILDLAASVSALEQATAAPFWASWKSRKAVLAVFGIITAILASPAVTGLVSGPLALKVIAAVIAVFTIVEGAIDVAGAK